MSYYLWKGQDVFPVNEWDAVLRHENHFAYDPGEDEPADRWGMISKKRWWPRHPDSIPPMFKARLLLLGVPTT